MLDSVYRRRNFSYIFLLDRFIFYEGHINIICYKIYRYLFKKKKNLSWQLYKITFIKHHKQAKKILF